MTTQSKNNQENEANALVQFWGFRIFVNLLLKNALQRRVRNTQINIQTGDFEYTGMQ